MKVTIAKYELYPEIDPTGYAVGYYIKTENDRIFYIDTIIPLNEVEGKNDEEIVQLAWNSLEGEINQKVEELQSKPPLVGSTWNPIMENVDDGGVTE